MLGDMAGLQILCVALPNLTSLSLQRIEREGKSLYLHQSMTARGKKHCAPWHYDIRTPASPFFRRCEHIGCSEAYGSRAPISLLTFRSVFLPCLSDMQLRTLSVLFIPACMYDIPGRETLMMALRRKAVGSTTGPRESYARHTR